MTTSPFRTGPFPRACAHRGGSAERPENTLLAFEHAASLGIRYVETDLHLTRDGVLVCHHDETLDRTTDGTGGLAWKTLAELQGLDAAHRFTVDGRTFPHRGAGVRIPTLDEAFACHPELHFTLELKPRGHRIARAVVDYVERRRLHDRVVVSCFHDPTLRIVRELGGARLRTATSDRGIRAFWLLARVGLAHRAGFPQHSLQVPPVHEGTRIVDARFVREAHRAGIEVHAWTIDEPSEMRRLLDLGVDAIMTDRPSLLVEVLRERGEG